MCAYPAPSGSANTDAALELASFLHAGFPPGFNLPSHLPHLPLPVNLPVLFTRLLDRARVLS